MNAALRRHRTHRALVRALGNRAARLLTRGAAQRGAILIVDDRSPRANRLLCHARALRSRRPGLPVGVLIPLDERRPEPRNQAQMRIRIADCFLSLEYDA